MKYEVGMKIYAINDYEMGMILSINKATVTKINGDRIYCEADDNNTLFGSPKKKFWFKNMGDNYIMKWSEWTLNVDEEVEKNINKYNEIMKR